MKSSNFWVKLWDTRNRIWMNTDNPFYSETRYNDKIRYNDNLTVAKPSLKKKQLVTNYAEYCIQ